MKLAPIVALSVLLGHAVVTTQVSNERPAFEEATVAGIDRPFRNHDRRQLTTTTFFDRTDLLQFIVSAYLDADGAGACGLKITFGEECTPIVSSVPAWMRIYTLEVAARLPSASLPVDALDRLRNFRFTSSPRRNVYPLPVQLMLQRLLEETFDLRVRRERREVPVWAITARTKESTLMHSSLAATSGMGTNGLVFATRRPSPPRAPDDPVQLVFQGSSLKDAADFFSAYLDRPVIDRTGLDGEYDFTFEFKPNPGAPWPKRIDGREMGPYLPLMAGFDAARLAAGLEPLGFTLEPATAPFDVLVIEHGTLKAQQPAFEVASVKPNRSSDQAINVNLAGRSFTATNVPLRELIRFAYDVQNDRLIGGPSWIATERFDVNARADHDLPAWGPSGPPGEVLRMVQTLLADRFRLVVHRETRELPVYALIAARSDGRIGPDIRRSTLDCEKPVAAGPPQVPGDPARPSCGMRIGPGQMVMGGTAMPQFANVLSSFVRRVVLDRTGLTGTFDFRLSWTPEGMRGAGPPPPGAPPLPPVDPDGASIFAAIQEQLGLKLEPQRASIDVVVIDGVEMPTPD